MKFLELKIPPVALLLFAAAGMWLIAQLLPALRTPFSGHEVLALTLALAGIAVSLEGVRQFRRARTTVNPLKPGDSSSLVTGGIYRWTRNPMYLGFALALLGWGTYLANPTAFFVLPVFILYMNCYQIRPEEQALRKLFGEAFIAYCTQVRRWL